MRWGNIYLMAICHLTTTSHVVEGFVINGFFLSAVNMQKSASWQFIWTFCTYLVNNNSNSNRESSIIYFSAVTAHPTFLLLTDSVGTGDMVGAIYVWVDTKNGSLY